jgi:hypothetical protein
VSQETSNHSFDELARSLAEGSISRRRALKLFAGTALAALIPSRALADDDDDCVRICHVPFDRQTGQCFFGQRENRCVRRSRLRVHLDEHPCDCRGRCRNCRRPTCQPFGVECTANDQCCSGRCALSLEIPGIRICNEECPVGRVPLSNGTCAVPCTSVADCIAPGSTETNCEGGCATEAGTGQGFCAGAEQGTNCADDFGPVGTIGCPEGQFCLASSWFCVTRCNPEPV